MGTFPSKAARCSNSRTACPNTGVRTYADGTTEAWTVVQGPGAQLDLFTPHQLSWQEFGELISDPPSVTYGQHIGPFTGVTVVFDAP